MRHMSFFISAAVLLSISTSLAAPRIEFDSKTYNCGTVIEGKIEKITAVFVVKNTGDAVLKLESVRPSCGCTVVKFDSLIQPGKSTKIESVVNIQGQRSGQLSKSITVTSNAENEKTVRLFIEATIQAPIDLSVTSLSLDGSNDGVPKKITLSTRKSDLSIVSVDFRSSEPGENTPAWQSDLSIPLKYKLTSTDSVRENGYSVYELAVYGPKVNKPSYGQITIRTNHLEKRELSLYCYIQP